MTLTCEGGMKAILWGAIGILILMFSMSACRAYPLCHGSSLISRDGLTSATRAVLNRAEGRFNTKFKIIGACVHKVMSTDSSRTSYHSWGMAVDLLAPPGKKAEVVSYLYHQERVLVMTYAGDPHIHFNLGQGQQLIGPGHHWASNGGNHETRNYRGRAAHGYASAGEPASGGPGSPNFR
jgi:hypothetical protein